MKNRIRERGAAHICQTEKVPLKKRASYCMIKKDFYGLQGFSERKAADLQKRAEKGGGI